MQAPTRRNSGRRVDACLPSLSTERADLPIRAGAILSAILQAVPVLARAFARVLVDNNLIFLEWWSRVGPEAGHLIIARGMPGGCRRAGQGSPCVSS